MSRYKKRPSRNPALHATTRHHVDSPCKGKKTTPVKGQLTNTRTNSAPGGRKATNQEIEARVDVVASLVCQQKTKSEIHAYMWRRYKLRWYIVDSLYIPRAKKLLAIITSMTKEDARKLGISVLMDVLRVGNPRERIAAESRLAEIHGYDAPKTLEHVGAGGGPIQQEHQFSILVPAEELP